MIKNCSDKTIYKLAKMLGVSMESLVTDSMDYRPAFETFKSNVCHSFKDKGGLDYLINTLETDKIQPLYGKGWYAESLYLLAMVDYLSRENDLPLCADYSDIRAAKLAKTIYPAGILTLCAVQNNDAPKKKSRREAIPEFMRFNIVESEVRNVI